MHTIIPTYIHIYKSTNIEGYNTVCWLHKELTWHPSLLLTSPWQEEAGHGNFRGKCVSDNRRRRKLRNRRGRQSQWWSTTSSDCVNPNPNPNQKQTLTLRNKISYINNKKPKSYSLKKLRKNYNKNVNNDELFYARLDPLSSIFRHWVIHWTTPSASKSGKKLVITPRAQRPPFELWNQE